MDQTNRETPITPVPETPLWPPREHEPQPEQPRHDLDQATASHEIVFPEPITIPDGAPAVVTASKSQLEKEIEDILSEDLENLFWNLPENQRREFKVKGEETASRLKVLLGETTLRIQEIFRLITEWLKSLPGVSQMFIEQEAKTKTEKLLKLRA